MLLERYLPDAFEMERTAPPREYLDQLADIVHEARQAPSCEGLRRRGPSRRSNENGEMPCARCGHYYRTEWFSTNRSQCKECRSLRSLEYYRTLRGNASLLVNSARSRSTKKGLSCSLQKDDIFEMLLEQDGRCHYSKVRMEIMFPHSNWRMSLERLNNSAGYDRQNCVLIAAEFNSSDYSKANGVNVEDVHGTAQWSVNKVQFLSSAYKSDVDVKVLQQDVLDASRKPSLSETHATYQHQYFRTLRGRSIRLVSHARARSRKKGQVCEISHADIPQMLLEQQGRCFYSGVPLQYQCPHTDWVMSLERLDNNLGYVIGNCVLIATEFNTPDHSSYAKGEVHGSSQWSLAKVMHVWGRVGFL